MKTEIWSASITIAGHSFENLQRYPIKRLPIHILMADADFIFRLKRDIGEKRFNSFQTNRETKLPEVKIEYIQYLSDVNNEE